MAVFLVPAGFVVFGTRDANGSAIGRASLAGIRVSAFKALNAVVLAVTAVATFGKGGANARLVLKVATLFINADPFSGTAFALVAI